MDIDHNQQKPIEVIPLPPDRTGLEMEEFADRILRLIVERMGIKRK